MSQRKWNLLLSRCGLFTQISGDGHGSMPFMVGGTTGTAGGGGQFVRNAGGVAMQSTTSPGPATNAEVRVCVCVCVWRVVCVCAYLACLCVCMCVCV